MQTIADPKTTQSTTLAWGLIGLIGVINVVLALSLAGRGQLELLRQYLVSYAIDAGRVSVLIAGFLLLWLSTTVHRGKVAGWWLSLGHLLTSLIGHLFKGIDLLVPSLGLGGWG